MTLTLRRFMMLGFIALLFVSSGSTVQAQEKTLILATTTSTQDTGLLDVLIPIFEKKTGYFVKTIAVDAALVLVQDLDRQQQPEHEGTENEHHR